ncbi:MAG: transglutaminase-like domain-containing protein, partial [Alistipes sp.]|nr:transglutaminase-like domain-containing protein [Alistipes sp.]
STQEGNPRVDTVALLSTFPTQHTLSPQGSAHRSVYLEQVARKDQPTIFTETLRQRCTAQYFSKEYLMAHCQPYDTLCEAYRTYTAERPPHILFSPQIVHQAQALAEGCTNPVEIMTRIYDWIDRMPWASAIEYSVIPSIPTYVMAHQRGDCGQVSLLLISMLRSLGIPARWESGWILYPLDGETGLHDWASVYYEGIGWVPVDVSFGNLMHIEDPCVRHFFRSGIDNYRWIVNRDYGQPFVPIKQYLRSEPIDFQRGEVESTQGNLYFDQWSYDLQVSYETE